MIWILGLLATQALPLDPVGPWEVSTNWVGCQIVRVYGTDKPVQIGIKATLTGKARSLLVTGPKNFLPDGKGNIEVTLDGKESVQISYGSFDVRDNRLRQLELFPSEAEMLRLASSTSITFGERFPPTHAGGIEAALRALDTCTTNLLTSWGVDPALYIGDKMASFTGNPGKWFSYQNYPREALAKGISGRVTLLLKTRPDGSVDDCKAVVSDDSSLNAGSCAMAKNIQLKPPLDAAGKAMASYAVLPISWTMTNR